MISRLTWDEKWIKHSNNWLLRAYRSPTQEEKLFSVIRRSAPKLKKVWIQFDNSKRLVKKGTVINCKLNIYSFLIQANMWLKIRQ